MILELGLSASGTPAFEIQRTVIAAVAQAISKLSYYAITISYTFGLTIRTQKWRVY